MKSVIESLMVLSRSIVVNAKNGRVSKSFTGINQRRMVYNIDVKNVHISLSKSSVRKGRL